MRDYDKHRDDMARRMRESRQKAAEIGPLPDVSNPMRRESCKHNLKLFCETYRPNAFFMGWSDDHIRCLEKMQQTCIDGGLFGLAMPRGSGKTTITITAAIWALLYGHRKWVCLVGATGPKAKDLLKSIQVELRFNEIFQEDFPEACYPIAKLEGKAARANGQILYGKPTNIKWMREELVFPTVEGSCSSGAVVSVAGITGDIRGQQRTGSDGKVIRPEFVILDDPQTRESAKSQQQTEDRLATINGDVLGLAGPGVKISGVMPCTVIFRDDLADRILDRERAPQWHGERTQMLYGWPKNVQLWDTYREIKEAEFRNGGTGKQATEFYIEHRNEMDEGCRAAWPERFNDDEVSGIQNAMNLYFHDEAAFQAEYQNQPLDVVDETTLTADEISERTNTYKRQIVPSDAEILTGFVDIQKSLLYYTVIAWKRDFTGYIVDYGSWPDQKTNSFRYANAKRTIERELPGYGLETQIKRALDALINQLCGKAWSTEEGAEMSINRLMIDANWGLSRNIVYQFCRGSNYRAVLYPSHGKYIGASKEPLNARHTKKTSGMTIGTHWRIDRAKDSPVRHVLYDTNYWKSFFHSRLSTEPGTRGSLTLFQTTPKNHRNFANQLRSEYAVHVESAGREVDEWKLRGDRPDNHWFDCAVGCCVAASIESCSLDTEKRGIHGKKRTKRRKEVSYL